MYVYGASLLFMSVVVTVWGVCGNVCCVTVIVKDMHELNSPVSAIDYLVTIMLVEDEMRPYGRDIL